MDIYSRDRSITSQGFILPTTLITILLLAMLCMSKLDELLINQKSLIEKQNSTAYFLAFQSAKAELCALLNMTSIPTGTGELTEGTKIISYSFQTITPDRFKVDLIQKTNLESTADAWFVYNRKTKKIEKWVTQ